MKNNHHHKRQTKYYKPIKDTRMEKREIKFRAWDGDKKVMHLPEYSDPCDFHIFADGSIVETHEHGYERHELTSRRPDSWVLMQYTGLKDKNGVEIYEGDIVVPEKYKGWDSTKGLKMQIVFHEGMFCLQPNNYLVLGYKPLRDSIKRGKDTGNEFEIIGNIYEHPHLLLNPSQP